MPNGNCSPISVSAAGAVQLLQRVTLGLEGERSDRREAFLQDLVHAHPSLLPMDQIEPAFTPLVSICKELGTGTGSIDNLWMTPRGGIVLGECKRVRNAQARREVLVQALDYACSLQGWSYERLQDAVGKARGNSDLSLWHEATGAQIDADALPEAAFEDAVQRRLRQGSFVVLMILDGVQEGLETLTQYLQLHAGLHVSLAIVELSMWKTPADDTIVVPRIPMRTKLIDRGIVTIAEDGKPQISEGQLGTAQHGIPKSYTNSEAEFYDRLESRVPGAKSKLERFLKAVEATGIVPEYGRALVLRWYPGDGETASAGYIDASGLVWFGDAYRSAAKLGNEQAGKNYIEALANAVGGSVQYYTNGTSNPRVRGNKGQTVSHRTFGRNAVVNVQCMHQLSQLPVFTFQVDLTRNRTSESEVAKKANAVSN
jgi:hypothetical protein